MGRKIIFIIISILLISILNGFTTKMPKGLSFEGTPQNPIDIEFLYDLTYERDRNIIREQTIFAKELELIKGARKFIIIDMFLFNDDYDRKFNFPPMAKELTEVLIAQKKAFPELDIIFITDEINNFYGAYESKFIKELKENDINVVITDSTKIRDSNPIYAGGWRTFIQWFGTKGKGWLPNPFSPDSPKVTFRSYLKLLNFKANHRKVLITEEAAILSSANLHDASGYHSNIAFQITGKTVKDLIQSELAVARFSGRDFKDKVYAYNEQNNMQGVKVSLITEGKIRENLLDEIKSTTKNDKIIMGMFYLSDRPIIKELIQAAKRDVEIRLILDANKDAFGIQKNGVPNRPVAAELLKKTNNSINIKWYDTHGEQYHSKMSMIEKGDRAIIIGGSANLTRRNIGDYNLESNIRIEADKNNKIAVEVSQYFDRIWNNEGGIYTVDYSVFQDESLFKYVLYRFQEWSGLSTF